MALRKQKITVPFTKGQSAGSNSILENEKLQQMTNCYIDNAVARGGVKQIEPNLEISPDINNSTYRYMKSLNRLEGQLVLESDTGFHKIDPKAGTASTISTDVRARASVVSTIGGISTLNSFDISENGVFRCVIYSNGLNTPITDSSNLYLALYENNLLVYTTAVQEGTKVCGAKVLPNGASDFAIFFYRNNGSNQRVVARKLTTSTRTLGAEVNISTPYLPASGDALFDVVAETYSTVRYGMTVRTTSATEVTFIALDSTLATVASRVFTTTGSVYGMSLGVGEDLDNKLAFYCFYGDESALGVLRCALSLFEAGAFGAPTDIAVSIVTYISRIAALSGSAGAGTVYYESQSSGADECRHTRIYYASMDSSGTVGSQDQLVLAGYFLNTAKTPDGVKVLLEVLNVSTAQYVSGGAYSKLDFQATNLVLLGGFSPTSFKVLARFEPRLGLSPFRVYPHLTSNFIVSQSSSGNTASFQVRMLRQVPIELQLTQSGTTNAPPSVEQFKSGSNLQVVELDVRS